MKPKFNRFLAASATSVIVLSSSAFAQTTWNGSVNSSWATPGNWSAGIPAGNLAVFGAGSGAGIAVTNPTQTLDGSYSVLGLSLGNSNLVTINAGTGGTLTIGSSGILLNSGTGAGVVINAPVALSAAQSWTTGGTTNTRPITVSGTVGLGANQLTVNPLNTNVVTLSGVVSGTGGSILKTGGGTLILNPASLNNSYTGGTTISGGVLQVGAGAATAYSLTPFTTLGSGAVTINSAGTVNMWTGTTVGAGSYIYNNAINLNGGTLQSLDGNYNFAGAIALTTGTTSTIRSSWNNKRMTLSGGITGSDTAKLNLGRNNDTSTLMAMSGTNAVGSVGINGGVALTIGSGSLTIANDFFVGNNVAGNGSGNATVNQTGGAVTVSKASSGFGSGFNIAYQAGTSNYNLSGGTLDVKNSDTILSTGGSALGTLAISGTGVANLKGISMTGSASGQATINLTGGRLNIGSGGISGSAGTRTINLGAGTVGASADWASSQNMTLTSTTTGTTFNTLDSVDNSTARTITLSGNLTGTGGKLNKDGAGTLILSGANNTYSGATTVSVGTLYVNGALTNSAVAVNGGTLGGIGIINQAITVAAGGTLAPGNSIGTLNAEGDVNLDGTLQIEYGTVNIDFLAVLGQLDLTGSTASFVEFAGALDGTNPYIFATYGSLVGTFATNNAPAGYEINYAFGGNNIALVVIPEPSVALLGGLGMLALLRRRRN